MSSPHSSQKIRFRDEQYRELHNPLVSLSDAFERDRGNDTERLAYADLFKNISAFAPEPALSASTDGTRFALAVVFSGASEAFQTHLGKAHKTAFLFGLESAAPIFTGPLLTSLLKTEDLNPKIYTSSDGAFVAETIEPKRITFVLRDNYLHILSMREDGELISVVLSDQNLTEAEVRKLLIELRR